MPGNKFSQQIETMMSKIFLMNPDRARQELPREFSREETSPAQALSRR
jgi:hypothetical protein